MLWAVAVTWPRYERRVAHALARQRFYFYRAIMRDRLEAALSQTEIDSHSVRIVLGPFTGLYKIYRGGRRNHDLVELQLGQVSLPLGNLVAAELREEEN